MSSFTWTGESHALLKDETRKLQFDFEKIASSIRSHFSHLMCEVTASDCRIAYAQEYIAQSAPEELDSKLEIEDSMTFEEIMDVVETRNERSEKRKQKIFSRVLASLGTPSETIQLEESYELEKIKSNIAERKKMKQLEQERKEKYALEQEEQRWIESEREKLRQRFAPGSVDAEGEKDERIAMFVCCPCVSFSIPSLGPLLSMPLIFPMLSPYSFPLLYSVYVTSSIFSP